ncbi:hypothetical protein ACWGIU_25755, partial [Streptomyces sp. NPDC054840]
MRTLARRLLIPGLTALALTATGCGSTPHGDAAGPAAPAAVTPSSDGTSQQLDVAAAPQGTPTPAAVARADGKGRTEKSALKVASYDRATGRAVIAKGGQTPGRSPSPGKSSESRSPEAGRSPEADKPVAVGDVIASAPAPGAPAGLLAKVTEVVGKTDKVTEVKTAATTLAAVLGDDKADGKVPVD